MNIIIILIVGALVGWLAGMIMRSGGGILFDIVIGIVGALIAGFLFGGRFQLISPCVGSPLAGLIGALFGLAQLFGRPAPQSIFAVDLAGCKISLFSSIFPRTVTAGNRKCYQDR